MAEKERLDSIKASSLGWRPGDWPHFVTYDGMTFKRAKCLTYFTSTDEMEFAGYEYESITSVLTVHND